jgi:beta-aspartyl-peptidase (threonine type)
MSKTLPGTRRGAVKKVPTPRARPQRFVLVVHGGAGVIERASMTSSMERAYRNGVRAALDAGRKVLAVGGSSLDAVVAAVTVFEDDPLFNAGRGAVFTASGTNELEAAIMDGATLKAGAASLLTTVKNPIQLARLVMEKTQHVMLASDGAERLANDHGLERVAASYFFTERRFKALQRVQEEAARAVNATSEADKHGTVGAVALDSNGNLAAATSTGGRNNKLAGRIGDTPIIGAGTYASNVSVAVSGTGEGEYFQRTLAAHTVAALVEYRGYGVARAAKYVVEKKLAPLGGTGGLIALDRNGRIAMPFNTPGMYRGYVTANRGPVIKIYADEA